MALGQVDIGQTIDAAPISLQQYIVFATCALVAVADGFDTQAIAFAAPAIAQHWSVPPEMFGAAFGAGLLGGLIGGLLLGPIGDRIGRRAVLGFAVVLFAITSYGSATSQSIEALTAWRFATGIGLGGAIPNLIAITAEYAPKRLRQTIVTIMFCGFPLGAVLGGAVSARLLQIFDWRAIFILGAILPVILLPLVLFVLPPSVALMVARGKTDAMIGAVVRRIVGRERAPEGATYFLQMGAPPPRARVAALFSRELWLGTVLLWATIFMSLLLAYFLINWTPLLLRQAGMELTASVYAAVLLNLGSIGGGIFFSRLSDRFGIERVLPISFALGAMAAVMLGVMSAAPATATALTLFAAFVAGAFCLGSQVSSIGVVALYYPVHLTSTGVGFTLAAGRIGSFMGPLGAGVLLALGLGTRELFFVAAIPALIASAGIWGVGMARKRRGGAAAPAAPAVMH